MSKMFSIVEECLQKYVGGNTYFDELDDKIKYDPEILQELLDELRPGRVLILNGSFGFNMVHHIMEQKKAYPYILLTGSPRKNEEVDIYAMNMYGGKRDYPSAVFIDDTYFSGRTYYYCKGFIEAKFNLKVNTALVAYDGSRHKANNVVSLYRYYDHHSIKEN